MHSIRPLILACCLLAGCASTGGQTNPKDPLEPFNRSMYELNDKLDHAIVKPIAQGYATVIPPTGRTMIGNFFSNLDDIVVTVNDLLQFKLKQAFSDAGRVLINTTVGAFGLVDAASITGYDKHNEDFGQTLGKWGVPSGPYLVLPLLGPSTVRDGAGLYVDSQISVIRKLRPIRTRNGVTVTKLVNKRADLLSQEELIDTASLDRYTFLRDAYLQRRENLIYDGNPPREKYDDDYGDDTALDMTPPPAATQPSAAQPGSQTEQPAPSAQSAPDSGK
jgi:phospholipid-binding lipoprotein MlaA